jgi:hypothetical protein
LVNAPLEPLTASLASVCEAALRLRTIDALGTRKMFLPGDHPQEFVL